jgi:hypothetical protein
MARKVDVDRMKSLSRMKPNPATKYYLKISFLRAKIDTVLNNLKK